MRCNASKAEAQSSLAVISPKHYFSQVSSATKTCFSLFSTQVLRSRRLPMPSAEKKFTYLRNCDIKLHGASQMTTLAECPVCYKRLHRRTAIQCLRCQECFHEACLEDHNKPYPDIEFSPAEERDGRFLYLPGFKPLVIRHEPREDCPMRRFANTLQTDTTCRAVCFSKRTKCGPPKTGHGAFTNLRTESN